MNEYWTAERRKAWSDWIHQFNTPAMLAARRKNMEKARKASLRNKAARRKAKARAAKSVKIELNNQLNVKIFENNT